MSCIINYWRARSKRHWDGVNGAIGIRHGMRGGGLLLNDGAAYKHPLQLSESDGLIAPPYGRFCRDVPDVCTTFHSYVR